MGSLEKRVLFSILGKLDKEEVKVYQERCVMVRNRNAHCLNCAKVCTTEAISYAENELLITPDLCIGCGSCATVCPSCALESMSPDDVTLAKYATDALIAGQGFITFACGSLISQIKSRGKGEKKSKFSTSLKEKSKKNYDNNLVVESLCLGRMDESILIELAARGAEHIYFARDNCRECELKPGGLLAELVLSSAGDILKVLNSKTRLHELNDLPDYVYTTGDSKKDRAEANYDKGKRAFFTNLGKDASDVVQSVVNPTSAKEAEVFARGEGDVRARVRGERDVDARTRGDFTPKNSSDDVLPRYVPARRIRLLNSMRHIAAPSNVTMETRIWADVSIDTEQCNSCQMCTVFCPTGALSKYEEADGTSGVEHRPTICVGCNLCEQICMSGALKTSPIVCFDNFLSGKSTKIPMNPRPWQANKSDSMYKKMTSVIGGENIATY